MFVGGFARIFVRLCDDTILQAMADEPILMNRPIVVTAKGVRLCRPADSVHEILP